MKIRIAVAVDRTERWYAYGHSLTPESESANEVAGDVFQEEGYHLVWVEADVPLPPEPPVVEGTVQPCE